MEGELVQEVNPHIIAYLVLRSNLASTSHYPIPYFLESKEQVELYIYEPVNRAEVKKDATISSVDFCTLKIPSIRNQTREARILVKVITKLHFEDALNSVRSVLPAGAAIPLECERKLCLNFPNLVGVCSLYGTAEVGILARSGTADHIGFLMPHVEVKVSQAS